MSVVNLSHSTNSLTYSCPASCDDGLSKMLDQALNDPANRFLSQTGKRVRTAIVNESYRAAGGQGDAPAKIAEAIELLHAGSLIVDDIEDDSAMRRGQATLHREVGIPIALNIGNWMYFRSLEHLSEVDLSRKNKSAILARVVHTIRRCHEGQALDLGASVETVPVHQIYPTAREISRLKTGGLTALSSWLGATTAGADVVKRKALARFGMAVGMCLQMQNDLAELRRLLDGEQRVDDLRNARVTWAWGWATKLASKTEIQSLQLQLTNARGKVGQYQRIASCLLDLVGDRGDALIASKLQREMRLLGEHVESTQGMRSALTRLQQKR